MGCNNEILVYSKYYKANLPMQFLLLIIVVLTNWILIPKYEIIGASIATCISVFIYNIIRFIYLWKRIGVQPFSKSNFIVLIILLFATIFGSQINFNFHPFLNIFLRSSIVIIPVCLLFYYLKISKDINGLVDKLVKQIFVR